MIFWLSCSYCKITDYKSSSSNVFNLARYSIASVVSHYYSDSIPLDKYNDSIEENLQNVIDEWPKFEKYVRTTVLNRNYYFKEVYDKATGDKTIETNWASYYKGRTLNDDLKNYFNFV